MSTDVEKTEDTKLDEGTAVTEQNPAEDTRTDESAQLYAYEFKRDEIDQARLRKAKKIPGIFVENVDDYVIIKSSAESETALFETVGEFADADSRVVRPDAGKSLFRVLSEQGFDAAAITSMTTIFEAAVAERDKTRKTEFDRLVEQKVEQRFSEISDDVNVVLAETVGKWLLDNRVNATDAIRLRNAENFMKSLNESMTSAGVFVPEDKGAVYESLKESFDVKSNELTAVLNENASLKADLRKHQLREYVGRVSDERGLSDLQRDRLVDLLENVEDFEAKGTGIVEAFFSESKRQRVLTTEGVHEKPLSESIIGEPVRVQKKDPMDQILGLLGNRAF